MSRRWAPSWYVLRDRIAFPAEDPLEVMSQDRAAWRVAETTIADGALRVSTVFLGLDHNWGAGEPLLFETMVFLAEQGTETRHHVHRYSTWGDAEAGHAVVVRLVTLEYQRSVDGAAIALDRLQASIAIGMGKT